jgi:hypothetical protein
MQTMGDFTNMSESLSLMPDAALQRFAQMHKDDPFTLALAVSESNRRKKMRTAQQGLAGMQQQAPVADQEIAQMGGVSALPAPGLAGMPAGGIAGEEEAPAMAGGGLVAFANGGDVERYSGEFGSFTGSQGFFGASPAELAADELRRQKLLRERAENLRISALIEGREPPRVTNTAAPAAIPDVGSYDRATATRRDQYTTANTPPAQAGVREGPAPDAGLGAGPATTVMPGGIGDINAMFTRALSAQKYEDPAKADVANLGRTMTEASEGRVSEFDKYIQKTGDVFKGREERLGKRESELEKQKESNTGLAFLNAGLAIMSTPGGLATAIGKGARVGTEQFASGLEKIRAAKDRLNDARDRVEELKLNRADMTFKDRQALLADVDKAKADALKLGIEGTRMAAGVTEKRAAEVVGNQVRVGTTMMQEAGANARAAMQERGATARAKLQSDAALNSPERLAFAAELRKTITEDKPQGDPLEAYRRIVETKREPASMEQLRKDWNDMAKRLQISQDYPNIKTFEDYALVMGLGGAGGGGGGGGGGGFSLVGTRPAQ